MDADIRDCPACDEPIRESDVYCRCGHFLGFPNYRAAASERDELTRRYDVATADASRRGVASLLGKLEALVEGSRPVIAMPFQVCDDLLRYGKYRNYHQRIASGEREPAEGINHADREMVGARLFPAYQQHIQYAALSPDGRGLPSYGPVAVQWDVAPVYLGRRVSLLDENSFAFFERHALGRLGVAIPPGHRADWTHRALLVAAK